MLRADGALDDNRQIAAKDCRLFRYTEEEFNELVAEKRKPKSRKRKASAVEEQTNPEDANGEEGENDGATEGEA